MIIRERGMYSVNLSLKDFQNIVRWKSNACKENTSLNDKEIFLVITKVNCRRIL